MTDDDWDSILNNVCMASFMQGFPVGLSTFNSYAVIKSNNNNTYVDVDNMYFTDNIMGDEASEIQYQTGGTQVGNSYHKIDCPDLYDLPIVSGDTYQADLSAEFKYDAKKFITKIQDLDNPIIKYFYDDTSFRYYEAVQISGSDTDADKSKIENFTIGDIVDTTAHPDALNTSNGEGVRYFYDHRNPGCYECIIGTNYTPVVKYHNGRILLVRRN